MRRKVFEFTIEANVGTQNPIVARLGPQSVDMIGWIDIDKSKRDDLVELYVMTLRRRLVRCWELREELAGKINEQTTLVDEGKLPDDMRPSVVGLQHYAESFLYEAKNYLRDLLDLFEILFGRPNAGASDLADPNGGQSKLMKWVNQTFGPDSDLAHLLAAHEAWIAEVIKRRNAVEHPGGWSGTMVFHNMRRAPDRPTAVVPPSWQRDDASGIGTQTDMVGDIDASMSWMLNLAEDVLATVVMLKPTFPHIRIYSIPPEKRDPACAIRLRVGMSPELDAKLAEAKRKP